MSFINIVLSIVILGVMVTLHEFGHFSVAKLSGIKVNKFAIGMGPRIFKFTKGETEYSLRLFPIGGFCAMEGEDDDSDDSHAFRNKPVLNRIGVIAAGPIMNLILGFVVAIVMTCTSSDILSCRIAGFGINSNSDKTGLQVGDEIVKMDGTRIFTTSDISYKLSKSSDGVFDVVVKRDGKKIFLEDVKFQSTYYYHIATNENGEEYYEKFASEEEYTGEDELKVVNTSVDFRVSAEDKTVITVIGYSFRTTLSLSRFVWMSLVDLVRGKYTVNDLSGPVGIVKVVGEVRAYGLSELLYLVCMLTLNLGIFNLLPLPALDGGRLVFLIIEAIRKKPVPAEKEGMVHFIGMALFMILMIVVTIGDIKKI